MQEPSIIQHLRKRIDLPVLRSQLILLRKDGSRGHLMATNPKHYYTLDEYFGIEQAGDARFEYWDGEIVCMSGGSKEHSRISTRITARLASQLEERGGDCEAFTADQAVKNHASSFTPYFYPDASAVCAEAAFEQIRGIDVLLNPTALVEVSSPHSESRDRDKDAKLQLYKRIPSLMEYLIVAQDKPEIIHHIKKDDGSWTVETVADFNGAVTLPSIGCRLALKDLYERVEFNRQ